MGRVERNVANGSFYSDVLNYLGFILVPRSREIIFLIFHM